MTGSVLVTGAQSQLARCMRMAGAPPGWRAAFLAREELDIADEAQVQTVLGEAAPDCIVNTAAYTAVDRAETRLVARSFVPTTAVLPIEPRPVSDARLLLGMFFRLPPR